MMMDLAYSALLLNSNYLAEEVMSLEEQMDQLHIDFQCEVLSKTEEETNPRELLGIIRMGNVTERIADAASEIAEVVLRGGEPHPILSMVIQDAEETVEHVTVSKDSIVVGKTLKQAQIAEETGISPGTVRPALRSLLSKKYVTQERDRSYKSKIPFTEIVSDLFTNVIRRD